MKFGSEFLGWFFKRKLKKAGKHIAVERGVYVRSGENVEIGSNILLLRYTNLRANHGGYIKMGNNIVVNSNACIDGSRNGKVVIGDNVLIAQNVVIRASDHSFDKKDIPIINQGHLSGEVIIGDGAWICANAVITRNVKIGKHAIVGAASVVTKDVEPYSIVGGVPAKLIRKRNGLPRNNT